MKTHQPKKKTTMSNAIVNYKNSLLAAIHKRAAPHRSICDAPKAIFEQLEWGSDDWKFMGEEATEEILVDANSIENQTILFEYVGFVAQLRQVPKSLDRVKEKHSTAVAKGKAGNLFGAGNDWMAARLYCRADFIVDTIVKFKEHVARIDPGAIVGVRGETDTNPYAHLNNDGTIKDPFEYVYLYTPRLGYIVEIQIGEPAPLLCFEINSQRRNDPTLSSPFGREKLFAHVVEYVLRTPGAPSSEELRAMIVSMYGSHKHNQYAVKLAMHLTK